MPDATGRTTDELRADLEYARQRLRHYGSRLSDAAGTQADELHEQAGRVALRATQLAERLAGASALDEVDASSVDDLHAAVDALESDLEAAGSDDGRMAAAVERQLRAWRARAEHLRVQANLAAMDVDDEIEAVMRRIGSARAKAVAELADATADGRGLASDVRDDIGEALGEIREIVERTADRIAAHRA